MKFKRILIEKIRPNPNNPRGMDIATQDPRLPALKESIASFGVLVPIVVTQRDNEFLLMDGERRYVAAKALGEERIPAYISEEGWSDRQILYRMFQMHHNREPWGPIPQCNALEPIYQTICRNPSIQSIADPRAQMTAIAEKLSTKTGIESQTAYDRVRFLRWPKDVKRPLYENPNRDYWYICEIEDRIIVPALRNYPEYFDTVPVDEVRRDLYAKLKHHSVSQAREVRHVKVVFSSSMTKGSDRTKVKRILRDLHTQKDMTYAEAHEQFTEKFPGAVLRNPPSPARLLGVFRKLTIALDDFDPESIKTAKRRARAKPQDLKDEAIALAEALESFVEEIKGFVGKAK